MSAEPTPQRSWRAFVPGIPAAKGSTVQWRGPGGQRIVREASRRVKPWVEAIEEMAAYTRPAGGPLQAPVAVRATFLIPRPPTNRNPWPSDRGKGDIDKLLRAALDGITGPVVTDDAHVVWVSAVKLWAPTAVQAGLHLYAWEIPPERWEAFGAG